ncbi:hypothetical protein AB0L53_48300 [Nonomuraea sp. NPDC052129]|uniref:hypothetical protein n=1 Tax=Nonomuraea sp. NPDC052129 TaxID=3154651 RepID=UPI00343926A8
MGIGQSRAAATEALCRWIVATLGRGVRSAIPSMKATNSSGNRRSPLSFRPARASASSPPRR